MDKINNAPLDEMMSIIDYSLEQGFTVVWGSDISEKGFSWTKGLAVVPERIITQEMRQLAFDNYQTTDDHGMYITGLVKDQAGTEYFYVKNSWGTTGNNYNGFFYASKPFVAYKTIYILVHKDGIPEEIRKKLGL